MRFSVLGSEHTTFVLPGATPYIWRLTIVIGTRQYLTTYAVYV
ncbi:MAG: hypothetical protein AAF915_25235 [Cyanobacteria bacterium P01_D01_bin.50]